jgi:hypothetical protein
MNIKADRACTEPHGACASLPRLVRMNYFHGQLIGERDLRAEQDYFRARLRHANRCLHGYGVLCGLELQPVPDLRDCPPKDEERRERLKRTIAEYDLKLDELRRHRAEATEDDIRRLEEEREKLVRELEGLGSPYPPGADEEIHRVRHRLALGCGAAIDCEGNDIVVRQSEPVDLDALLGLAPEVSGEQDAGHLDKGPYHEEAPGEESPAKPAVTGRRTRARYAYLSICYRECGLEPTRPFELDECATSLRCHDARVAEGWRLTASWQRPAQDERCELCCTGCEEACLLLARIRVDPDRPVGPDDIDHSVRRRFGLYEPTVITGIGWRHAFTYSLNAADQLLGTNDPAAGLEIRFSRPVRADTLEKGVVDLWRIEGGKGGRGEFRSLEPQLIVPATADGLVDRFTINNSSRERVQLGDRIFVVVRGAFILDSCCRAVEGAHLGGRVPRLPGESEEMRRVVDEEAKTLADGPDDKPPDACAHPPHGPVPWTTGAGGNFESWFYISDS